MTFLFTLLALSLLGGKPPTSYADSYKYQEEGYANVKDWFDAYQQGKKEGQEEIKNVLEEWSDSLSDEQKEELDNLKKDISNAHTTSEIQEKRDRVAEISSELEEQAQLAQMAQQLSAGQGYSSYYSDGSGLTKSSGVNYYNGRKETYYSSRVLYHYRTSEWSVDSEGWYRDSDGNYVVAASDMAQGTTFEGSKGTCKVYDSGCAAGTTDYYCAF